MKNFLRHLWESRWFYFHHTAFLIALGVAFFVLVLKESSWLFVPAYFLLGLPDVWRNWKLSEREQQKYAEMKRIWPADTCPRPEELKPLNLFLAMCLTAFLWLEWRLNKIFSLYRTEKKWAKILEDSRPPHDA